MSLTTAATGAQLPPTDDLRPRPEADPYPRLARLRALDPDLWWSRRDWRGLVRYDDVREALRDPRLASAPVSRYVRRFLEAQLPTAARPALGSVMEIHQAMMLYTDGKRHRRLRGTVQPEMTPAAIERLAPVIERTTEDLLSAIAPAGEADLIADLAAPLPLLTAANWLGLPLADRSRFARWATDIFALVGPGGATPAHALRARRSLAAARVYLSRLGESGPYPRAGDALGRILAAGQRGAAGDPAGLSEVETLATALSVLVGGVETTANLIGNGLLALLRHPDQLEVLRYTEDPHVITRAVDEMVRYDGPVQLAARVATEPLEIGGKPIRRGEIVECWLGAANRDPDRFPVPDRFDIERDDGRHLGFGHGPHHCIGAALGRLQARLAIPTVLRRLPDLRLAVAPEELRWKPNVTFRGLETLPVRFRARPSIYSSASNSREARMCGSPAAA